MSLNVPLAPYSNHLIVSSFSGWIAFFFSTESESLFGELTCWHNPLINEAALFEVPMVSTS